MLPKPSARRRTGLKRGEPEESVQRDHQARGSSTPGPWR